MSPRTMDIQGVVMTEWRIGWKDNDEERKGHPGLCS